MPRTRRSPFAHLYVCRRLPALSFLPVAALYVALLPLAPGARAATVWHVSPGGAGACTAADPNCATIQAALTAASGGDIIQVTAGTYKEHVVIDKDLTVSGAGAAQTVVDGMQSGTVFTINNLVTVNLSGMTVTRGKTAGSGGGVLNSGTLNITNCAFSGNSADSGGGIFNGVRATATVTSSTVSNNSAVSGGGGMQNNGTLNITGSTVSGNAVSNNSASQTFGGGGIFNPSGGTLNVTSSTVSNNSASGLLSVGGGIFNKGIGPGISSSILAGNTAPFAPDIFGNAASQGHNLFGVFDGATTFAISSDIVGTTSAPVDPMLSPLGFYGGPTQTQLPLCGSPAIDAGFDPVTGAPLNLTTDQRGAARKVGAHVDIGAVERQQAVLLNSQDGGAGSLRQLIADAQDGAVIDLDPCAPAATVTLTSDELLINKNLTINGPGPPLLAVQRSAGPGTPEFRVFEVAAGVTANLSGMTVSGGKTAGSGGGILNTGTLNVTNFTVNDNSAALGAIANDGGTVNIANGTISGNSAVNGGGVSNSDTGTVNVTNSAISNNSASSGGGGIVNEGGCTLNVTSSTVSNNTATDGSQGGGINNGGSLSVTNGTISNNSASNGGGIFNRSGGAVNLTSSTVSNNSAGTGGGINNSSGSTAARLGSSIVAGNTAPSGPDLAGAFTSQGHNLVGASDGTNGFTNGTGGDIVGTASAPVDPQLLPLANYGGPTQTQLPLPSSPAIDAGDDAVLNPPLNLATDQRGFARMVGAHVDIGAVEFDAVTNAADGVFQFRFSQYRVGEGSGHTLITVTRTGRLTQAATVDFATADIIPDHLLPCGDIVIAASSLCDYEATSGTLQFAPGDSSKTFNVLINQDGFHEGDEAVSLVLSNPTGDSMLAQQSAVHLLILDDDLFPLTTNPIDDAQLFVRQHYHDFLNRDPDQSGLDFWTNEITSCGADLQCREFRRVNVSAAFFLSIEFQETGFLVERMYKAAYGDATGTSTFGGAHQLSVPVLRSQEFLRDTQEVRSTPNQIIVGQGNWQQQLADNQNAFALEFVSRQRFADAFPPLMTADAFVNQLNANAGGVLTSSDVSQLDAVFGGPSAPSLDPAKRAQVLRSVAENTALRQRESDRAFVLMQYFGYLRRNPNDAPDSDYAGYEFWLSKLEQFDGNFVQAEMVKAFISSDEYRHRFGL
jgi:hypothetical protein